MFVIIIHNNDDEDDDDRDDDKDDIDYQLLLLANFTRCCKLKAVTTAIPPV